MNEQQAFHTKNRAKLRKAVKDELIIIAGNGMVQASADRALPFVQDSHFFYLTGITEPDVMLVMDGKTEYLVIPERDVVRTAFEGAVDTSELEAVSGIASIKTAPEAWKELTERIGLLDTIATLEAAPVYIEHYEMFANPSRARLLQQIRKIKTEITVTDVRRTIAVYRMVKSAYEIKMIKRAIKETAKLFKAIERKRQTAKNEADLAAEISKIAIKNQLTNAYEPIIASGKNALTLHYVKNNAPLDKNSMLLLDIGLQYKGYAADITRTISFNPTQRQQEVFDAVKTVHEFALSIIKPGMTMREYELQVQDCMGQQLQKLGLIQESTKEAIRKYYPHATSHFLGIDVHDVADYELPFKANMVLTVEPGIYIHEENIGIRLEDDVQITKTGVKVLSDMLPKNIISLWSHLMSSLQPQPNLTAPDARFTRHHIHRYAFS